MAREYEERIAREQMSMKRITNNDLVCKDCVFKRNDTVVFGNTSRCEKYPDRKPLRVLLGGECSKKKEKKISI